MIRSKITFPSIFGGIGEAFGSFCAPKVNILGSESDMKHMSGFYAENEQPEVSQPQGDPPPEQEGGLRHGVHETRFFYKFGALACTRSKIDLFQFRPIPLNK